MRSSDWSSDVCSSDLAGHKFADVPALEIAFVEFAKADMTCQERGRCGEFHAKLSLQRVRRRMVTEYLRLGFPEGHTNLADCLHAASGGISHGGRGVDQPMGGVADGKELHVESRSEEHTSELESLLLLSYAGFY